MHQSKYKEYKTMYLQLINPRNGYYQSGSGINTAKTIFESLFNLKHQEELNSFIQRLNTDIYLKSLINQDQGFNFTKDNISQYKDKIFCIIARKFEESANNDLNYDDCASLLVANKFRDSYIDWVIKNYISGSLGLVEDMYKIKEDLHDYQLLKNNKVFINEDAYLAIGLNKVNGAQGLRSIIDKYSEKIQEIYKKKGMKKNISEEHRKIRAEGENPETIVVDTSYLTIYAPKTVEESKYYGCNTKWCTAAASKDNMFEDYSKRGQLYIIVPKQTIRQLEKYQLHKGSGQYMEETDSPIKLEYLKTRFKEDEEFLKWLKYDFVCELTESMVIRKMQDLECLINVNEKNKSVVKEITIVGSSYSPIKINAGDLPANLKTLKFENKFNLVPGILPAGLQELHFDTYSDPMPPNILPASLKYLKLGTFFNHPIEPGTLSMNLQHLILGNEFNQPIEPGVLPGSLQQLSVGNNFNQPIGPGVLPGSLQQLSVGNNFNQSIGPGVLPVNLQQLNLGFKFNQPIGPGVLPMNLQQLNLSNQFNQPIGQDMLPTNLQQLQNFNQPLVSGMLPTSLQQLHFGDDFNQPLEPDMLPANLQQLHFGDKFNQQIKSNVLPGSLQVLHFGNKFNQPIEPGVLPESLQTLHFGSDFGQEIKPNVLPIKLQHLVFGRRYGYRVHHGVLPISLERYYIGDQMYSNHNSTIQSLSGLNLNRSTNRHAAEWMD
jgi:hypothetical protein